MPVTDDNMAEVERLTRSVHKIWEKLMGEDASWRPGAAEASHRECEQAALEQTDRQLLGWAARDPDAKVGLVGFLPEVMQSDADALELVALELVAGAHCTDSGAGTLSGSLAWRSVAAKCAPAA